MLPLSSPTEVTSSLGLAPVAHDSIPSPSHVSAEEEGDVSFEVIYRTFFFPAFKGPRAIWKFLRSFFHALICPASLNIAADCGPGRRYLSAVHLSHAVFSIAVATSIVNFYSVVETGVRTQGSTWVWFEKYVGGAFESAYLLWLFGAVLMTSLLLERLWSWLIKAQVLSRRERAALFVYEVCVLVVPLLVISVLGEYRFPEMPSPGLLRAFIVYAIMAAVHFLVFLFQLGGRVQLPLWKRTLIPWAILYFFVFALSPGLLMALPFLFLPLLLLLYPLYAVLRDHMPMTLGMKRLFDRMQSMMEPDDE